MLLKIRRSQRFGGLGGNVPIFCLDARVEFTPEERDRVRRYRLLNQVIYNSEASLRHIERANANRATDTTVGHLKSIGGYLMAMTKLNISIASLERGHHIECKSLDELLGTEAAVMEGCENLKNYLDTVAAFDGRELLFDFSSGEPEMVSDPNPVAPLLPPPAFADDTGELVYVCQPDTLPPPAPSEESAPDPRDGGMMIVPIGKAGKSGKAKLVLDDGAF